MGATERIVLGSRGSDLALAQARMVEEALRRARPDIEIRLEIIRTSGDEGSAVARVEDRKAGRKGMFTREIEKQLLVRHIDLAVHSAKDLPSEMDEALVLAATLPRGETGDVLIARKGECLSELPGGAIVATGSVRRRRQLLFKRPDLQVVDLRGNVPTRLRKLRENDHWAAIILARAGLARLGLSIEMELLSPNDFVPAGGQGVIALQIRREDERLAEVLRPIDHRTTRLCLRAEREFLRQLKGDCDSPVGVHASVAGGNLQLAAQVFEDDSAAPLAGEVDGTAEEPEAVAAKLIEEIYGRKN